MLNDPNAETMVVTVESPDGHIAMIRLDLTDSQEYFWARGTVDACAFGGCGVEWLLARVAYGGHVPSESL